MNQKVKTILAGVLLLGGIGIWIPQLLAANKPGKPMNLEEFPAEGEFLEEDESFGDGAYETASLEIERRDDSEIVKPSSSTGVLSSLNDLLGNGAGSGRKLSDLSADWNEDAEPEDAGKGMPAPTLETVTEPPTFEDTLRDFLAENSLSGIIVGSENRLVSFGPYLFSEGDEILGSEAHITRVGKRHVILEYHGDTVRVDLPPFRSRTPRPSLDASTDSGSLVDGDPESEDLEDSTPEPLELPTSDL